METTKEMTKFFEEKQKKAAKRERAAEEVLEMLMDDTSYEIAKEDIDRLKRASMEIMTRVLSGINKYNTDDGSPERIGQFFEKINYIFEYLDEYANHIKEVEKEG